MGRIIKSKLDAGWRRRGAAKMEAVEDTAREAGGSRKFYICSIRQSSRRSSEELKTPAVVSTNTFP